MNAIVLFRTLFLTPCKQKLVHHVLHNRRFNFLKKGDMMLMNFGAKWPKKISLKKLYRLSSELLTNFSFKGAKLKRN